MLQFCCKFTSVSVCHKLSKHNVVWRSYCKIKGCNFFAPQCRSNLWTRYVETDFTANWQSGPQHKGMKWSAFRVRRSKVEAEVRFGYYSQLLQSSKLSSYSVCTDFVVLNYSTRLYVELTWSLDIDEFNNSQTEQSSVNRAHWSNRVNFNFWKKRI